MRASLHELWGCAQGPARRLAPRNRIVVGALALLTCSVAPAAQWTGLALIFLVCVGWLAACRLPLRVLRSSLLLALLLFLPYAAVVPLGEAGFSQWRDSSHTFLAILVRGTSGMLVGIATVASLRAYELRQGLRQLPIPNLIAEIVLQIVHQSVSLGYETKRIASAMQVRGASGGGLAAWRVLVGLPQVWLPRAVVRAERVADAMEVRGFCENDLPMDARESTSWIERVVVMGVVLAAVLAGLLRFWSTP